MMIEPFKIMLLTAICCYWTDVGAAELTTQRQKQLDSLLTHDCGSCHGLNRNGGLGPALHAKDMKKYSLESLTAVILKGISGTAMPPWGDLLSIEEARYLADELLDPKPGNP